MIGRVWRWLFDAHRHEWETIETEKYTRFKDWGGQKIPYGRVTLYTLRCKTCGLVTGRTVGPQDE